MAEGQYTPAEFAAKIKAQHPQYANIDDNELVSKVLKKYPEYQSQVSNNPKLYSFEEAHPIVDTDLKKPTTIKKPNTPALNRPAVDGTTVVPKKVEDNGAEPVSLKKAADQVYTAVRQGIGFYPSAVFAAAKAAQGAYKAEPGQRVSDALDSASASYYRNMEQSRNNEGLMGTLSDPINLTMLIPGLGEAKVAQGLVKAAQEGSKIAKAVKYGVLPAVENAGLTAASSSIDPTKKLEGSDIAWSGGLGGVGGLAGRGLQKGAISLFPGINKATKAKLAMEGTKSADAKSDIKKEIENELLKKVEGLGTRGSYENMANNLRESSSDKYAKVLNEVSPEIPKVENHKSFDEFLDQIDEQNRVLNKVLPVSKKVNEVKKDVTKAIITANKERSLGLKESEINSFVQDYVDRLTTNTGSKLATPRELQNTKRWINSDIYNSRMSENAQQKRDMAKETGSAINDMIEKFLTKDQKDVLSSARKDYSEYKTIDDYLEKYGVNDGSSWRFGHDGIAKYTKTGPMYLPQTTAYRAGGLAQRGLVAPFISLTGIDKKDSTTNKKK